MPKLKPNQFILGGLLITEHPMLFQTEMVQAIMEDRKTQTRRTKRLEEFNDEVLHNLHRVNGFNFKCAMIEKPDLVKLIRPPYGQPGDLLWVKETFTTWCDIPYYKQETKPGNEIGPWKPSIHMPKAASRIWLMVEDVRAEKLQDITEEDAKSEGIEPVLNGFKNYIRSLPLYWQNPRPAYNSFASLWKSINGEKSWKSNPWVWVIKFRILSKTGRPSDEAILSNHQQITNN